MNLPITKEIADRYVRYTGLEDLKQTGKQWFAKCPYCKRKGEKPRVRKFYILTGKGVNVFCHKCGTSKSFAAFLEDFSPSTLESIKAEVLLGKKTYNPPPVPKLEMKEFDTNHYLKSLSYIFECPGAIAYCNKRNLPEWIQKEFYYSDNFANFVFNQKLSSFKIDKEYDKRIIIPYFDDKGVLTHIQGRAIEESFMRYMTITVKEGAPKVWGFNRIDKNKTVYITEGVLDAVYLTNSLAFGSAYSNLEFLQQKGIKKVVFCFDHDIETNPNLRAAASKYLEYGADLFFFPSSMEKHFKDFNDLAVAGWNNTDIQKLVEENTCNGLKAKVKLAMFGGTHVG